MRKKRVSMFRVQGIRTLLIGWKSPFFSTTTLLTSREVLPGVSSMSTPSLEERGAPHQHEAHSFLFPLPGSVCRHVYGWSEKQSCICIWLGQSLRYTVDPYRLPFTSEGYSRASRLVRETGILRFDGILRGIYPFALTLSLSRPIAMREGVIGGTCWSLACWSFRCSSCIC
jgi:hypothetical protein